ncbi:hypothetical protein WN51_04240 [Melipona quadrifasciata]|uniref:Uncharacterized protein n=1 Tax=Melipona quadrifasciata TaxID=166423 RepID=A0A0M8ZW31_9HYME|nr:hypothetical protein WN51_04240 [Melipona quadrifasciata]
MRVREREKEREKTGHVFVECAAGRFFLCPTFSTVLKKKIKKKKQVTCERRIVRERSRVSRKESSLTEAGGIDEANVVVAWEFEDRNDAAWSTRGV